MKLNIIFLAYKIFWLNNLEQFRVRGVSEIRPYFVGVIRVRKKMSPNVGMRVTVLKRFYITLVIFGFWVVVYSLDLQVESINFLLHWVTDYFSQKCDGKKEIQHKNITLIIKSKLHSAKTITL